MVEITELVVPDEVDDAFEAYVRQRNEMLAEVVGSSVLDEDVVALRAIFSSTPERRRQLFTAHVDGKLAGRAMVTTRPLTPEAAAYLVVDVAAQHRRQGIGSALLETVEQAGAATGSTSWQAAVSHRLLDGGDRLASPTGFGDLPLADAGVAFALARGYALEQVVRVSRLDLGTGPDRPVDVAEGYRLLAWTGATPTDRRDDLAVLRTRMSTDAPMGELVTAVDAWDADRVRRHDDHVASGGQVVVTVAAEHFGSGSLAGFTEVVVTPGMARAVQEDTLVLREHRGHGLGLAMKTQAVDRKSTRLNSSHSGESRMPSSA